ncbi:MAG: CAP domain-containing protein [Acidimicrobiia bacterium]
MRTLIAFTVAVVMVLPAVPASADAVDSAVAAARGSSLPIRAELEQTAQSSASRQAANLQIAHTSLNSLTAICSNAGEIVGSGPSVQAVFDLFMQSGYHRDLLLSSNWTAMGTGAVTGSDGKIYVSVVFCREFQPTTVSPPPTEPPPPPTASTRQVAAAAPVVLSPAPPTYPGFHDVMALLLEGELGELWESTLRSGSGAPPLAPSPFSSPSTWVAAWVPALS